MALDYLKINKNLEDGEQVRIKEKKSDNKFFYCPRVYFYINIEGIDVSMRLLYWVLNL